MKAFYILWLLFWFFGSAKPGIAAFFHNDLYLFSVFKVVAAAIIGIAVYLLAISIRGVVLAKFNKEELILLLFAMIASLSVVFSPIVFENSLRIYGFLATTIVMLFTVIVCVRFMGNPDQLLMSMGKAVILGALLTAIAPLFMIDFSELINTRYGVQEVIHPNTIGFHVALALIFLLAGVRVTKSILVTYFFVIFFLLVLFLTFSKTSFVALVIALGVLWLCMRGQERMLFGFVIMFSSSVPLILLWDYLIDKVSTYFVDPSLYITLTGRLPIWGIVLELVEQNPLLGFGFATFREVMTSYVGDLWLVEIVHAHNAYFTVLFQMGIVGLTVILYTTYLLISRVWWHIMQSKKMTQRVWAATVSFMLIHALAEGSFGVGGYEFMLLSTLLLLSRKVMVTGNKLVPLLDEGVTQLNSTA